ncbi:MAG: PAAR domain-containing protein [Chitinophagaceae bacterium]
MKRIAAGLFLLTVLPLVSFSQQEYKGTVTLIPKGPDFNAAYYINKISMKVDAGGTAVLTANMKFGPKSDPGDYIAFTGSITGTFDGNELSLSGPLNQAMQDGKRFIEEAVTTRVSGQKQGDEITGTFYMRYDGKEESTVTFVLRPGEMVPELLFPLGKSPKVFDKGWLFGASFKITGKDNEEIDLTEQIVWSGSGSFEPDKGASSRPVFNSVGENKIILTAEYEGKKYSKEYKVMTVDANRYARVGSYATCPADGHGSMACPFFVTGPVMTGNANVLINGLPVACEGDRGRHAACAGPNTFVITGGDDEVLLNGKRVAKVGSATTHCGGSGHISSVETVVSDGFAALSKDVTFTNKEGKTITPGSKPAAGTKMITGPNGLVLISPDKNTVMMVLPNCQALITGNDGNSMSVVLEDGQLFINGEAGENNKQLLIETFNEKLVKKGTRFLFSHSKDSSRLIVYEGEVEVTLKNDNRTVLVPAGKVYYNDFKNPYSIADTLQFQSAAQLMAIPKDSAYWQMPQGDEATTQPAEDEPGNFITLLKKYWYVAIGVLLILLLVVAGRRKKGNKLG